MSDSYDYHDKEQGPWGKLYAYLNFRRLLQGLWVDEPQFWFKAITDREIVIKTDLYTDSGGGPLDGYNISVFYEYNEKKPLFSMSFRYRCLGNYLGISDDIVFVRRMKRAYSYMKSYAHGKSWFEKASCERMDGCLDHVRWNDIFGPLDDIGKMLNKDLNNMNDRWADKIFVLLDGVERFPSEDITFSNETAVLVKKARQWALLALLEMQRYYYTSC